MRARTVNFERGKDPKQSMGLGNLNIRDFQNWEELTKWIAKNLYYILGVPPDRVQKYYEDERKGPGGQLPTSIFQTIIEFFNDRGPFYVDGRIIKKDDMKFRSVHFSVDGRKYGWVHYLSALLAKMGWQTKSPVAESVNFERGQDPKQALGIGSAAFIPEITSDDLNILAFGWLYDEQKFSEEEFSREYRFEDNTEEDYQEALDRVKKVATALDGKIILERLWDWKEFDEMADHILSEPHKDTYPYVYNGTPGMDSMRLVWSSVPLPSAEEIV